MEKPFSQACENNKAPILDVLKQAFSSVHDVLEIGSGTGQHAVHFAAHLSHLSWQPSDLAEALPGMQLWLQESGLANVREPIALNLDHPWSVIKPTDAVFTANTLHIVSRARVEKFFQGVDQHLALSGKLCIYGPFNYGGLFTTESNARFDIWLKERDANSGIRDFEWINGLAEGIGLELVKDHEMPANNRLLEWQRSKEAK